ncbi:hypothetical protein B0T16DRAFT_459860 [Cercophora newfieldiana]|uniref:Extracellular membrane protein CFEM domain-containing protein n=1 Tax=Cercophora newfieldiana TaxID=92897 RepID=A0AA39Y1M2_9PEZI|nr:hypothetical protein B0T16DRAFT_459860 [Cercophora newfieldiana]
MASTLLLLTLSLLAPLTTAADTTTLGPLGYVSLRSELAYTTARRCAAGCLAYNGVLPCNVAGYQDLGVHFQCGCGPINACYCSKPLASSATAYISSCVSAKCAASVDSWPEEVTSMLGLYDGYCATANVAVETTATASSSASVATSEGGSSALKETGATSEGTGGGSGQPKNTGIATPAPSGVKTSGAGLGKGGIVKSGALVIAAGLGLAIGL